MANNTYFMQRALGSISDNKILLFAFGLFCAAYLFGVLSPMHYAVGAYDAYINYFVTLYVALGLFVAFLVIKAQKALSFGSSSIVWLFCLVIILLQPILHPNFPYVDALIFPVAVFTVAALLSVMTLSLTTQQKSTMIIGVAWTLVVAGFFTVVTQLVQLFSIDFLYPLVMPATTGRIYGNIAQPNQAGFVLVLGIASCIYLNQLYTSRASVYFALLVMLFGMGIGLAAGRAAILMVAAVYLGVLLATRQKNNILSILPFVLGYVLGTTLLQKFLDTEMSAVGRLVGEQSWHLRQTLLERGYYAFTDNPLFGIGYANFRKHALLNPELFAHIENSTHAHNIFAQVAAEFGVLGLVPLGWITWLVLRRSIAFLSGKLSRDDTFVFILLAVIGLYSMSEYPLWYARFLYLTAVLVALLDRKIYKADFFIIPIFFSVLIALGSAYYILQYDKNLYHYELIGSPIGAYETRVELQSNFPNTFGYRYYKDASAYGLSSEVLADKDDPFLSHKIAIGYDILQASTLVPQIRLLQAAGRDEEVLVLFEAACKSDLFGDDCHQIIKEHLPIPKI